MRETLYKMIYHWSKYLCRLGVECFVQFLYVSDMYIILQIDAKIAESEFVCMIIRTGNRG